MMNEDGGGGVWTGDRQIEIYRELMMMIEGGRGGVGRWKESKLPFDEGRRKSKRAMSMKEMKTGCY